MDLGAITTRVRQRLYWTLMREMSVFILDADAGNEPVYLGDWER